MLDERERVFAPLQANPRRDVHPPFIAGNSNFSAFDRTRSSFSNLANGTPILHEFTRKPIIPDRFYVLSFYTRIRILIACIYLLSWNLNADKWSEIVPSYRTIFISLTSLRYLIVIREEQEGKKHSSMIYFLWFVLHHSFVICVFRRCFSSFARFFPNSQTRRQSIVLNEFPSLPSAPFHAKHHALPSLKGAIIRSCEKS